MAIVRMCVETLCHTLLSTYNPTDRCWEHRKRPRRIVAELNGEHIHRDDDWLLMMRLDVDAKVETWRPHMMSETFVDGLERREMSEQDVEAYRSGEWIS